MIKGLIRVVSDPELRPTWRFLTLKRIAAWLMPGYRLPWPYFAWWNDESFNQFLEKFEELTPGHNADRRWMIGQLVKVVAHVRGDTAECGVFLGSSSYLICRALPDRTHFMFDSFAGLSGPTAVDGTYHHEGDFKNDAVLNRAKTNMQGVKNASFLPGWIPERFKEVESRTFSFVHIDVQLYQPTRDSIEFFYPRMNEGGIIVCDDYGFTNCPGARLAIDEFLADKPEEMITLSCGSAFLIKGLQGTRKLQAETNHVKRPLSSPV